MLEIKLSLDKDSLADVPYSTLTLFDTICGGGVGGHRVPTDAGPHATYLFKPGFEIDTFAPIVMYGSLESVRSVYMATMDDCARTFAPEDMSRHVYCTMQDARGSRMSYLRLENQQRSNLAPFRMQRDRLCSADWQISIEDLLAKPPQFSGPLYDTPQNDPAAVNQWIVPAWARGEEVINLRTMQLSLRSFVYITSSSDPSIRPGMHRLIDLPVFGNENCNLLPGVNCGGPGTYIPINQGPALLAAYESTTNYVPGRKIVSTIRCSQLVSDFTGQSCNRVPYVNSGSSCFAGDLLLLSEPKLYSSRVWLASLVAPLPSPPPLSPSPPPPNPAPPTPRNPPLPPYVQSQKELMEYVRSVEEQACTSVYYLTTSTRCERLAVALTRSVLYDPYLPPLPPPAQPVTLSPPPPFSPPFPSKPPSITETPVASSRLSSVRIPLSTHTLASGQRDLLFDDGYYIAQSDVASLKSTLAIADQRRLVRCTSWQASAPLPCATPALESNCMSSIRHCGTLEENSYRPSMQLMFSGTPASRGNRLWGFEIELPQNEELASLFFKSTENVGGQGYEVKVLQSDGSPVPCQSSTAQVLSSIGGSVPSNRMVQHVCAAGDSSDQDIYALGEALRLEITLSGQYRQLWIRSVMVMEVALASAQLPPRPPRPPPLPQLPPTPPKQPPHTCYFLSHVFFVSKSIVVKEPCGMTQQQCCDAAHAYQQGAVNAYEMDDAGCCLLIAGLFQTVRDTTRWGYLTPMSGTGFL